MIGRKTFFIILFIIAVLIVSFFLTLPDGRLHLVFCDVGQGDAAYIRTPSNQDALIDGGPNDKILVCLGNNMPFYDRTIDLILLSHPQKDHYSGISKVIDRYNVKYIVLPPVGSGEKEYRALLGKIENKKIHMKVLYKDDRFNMGQVKFQIYWPERDWVSLDIPSNINGVSQLSNLQVLGASTTHLDSNLYSYYLDLKYGNFETMFTGDGDTDTQKIIEKSVILPKVEVLKFPHHGSKYGMLPEILDMLHPDLTIISVGKNSYGHPAPEALEMLESRGVVFKRTDRDGEVKIVSDGNGWKLEN